MRTLSWEVTFHCYAYPTLVSTCRKFFVSAAEYVEGIRLSPKKDGQEAAKS